MRGTLEWLFNGELRWTRTSSHGVTVTVIPPIVVLLFIASCIWTAWDATRRGKSTAAAVLFIMLAWWPVSVLWWLWLRPPVLPVEAGARMKPLEWVFLGVILVTFVGVLVFLSRI